MKSTWIWISGIILVVWFLSDEKKEHLSTPRQQYESYAPQNDQTKITPAYSNSSFSGGYSCTTDCSGHEAGYKWAEENGIDDPDNCGGNSDSFIEGCHAYADEQQNDDGGPEE